MPLTTDGEPNEPIRLPSGLDWEIYDDNIAHLFKGDKLLQTVRARTRRGLKLKMMLATWKNRHHNKPR